jgi:hypothetical protein
MNKHRYLLLLALVCLPYRASTLSAAEGGQEQESSSLVGHETSINEGVNTSSSPPVKHRLRSQQPVILHTEEQAEANVQTVTNESQEQQQYAEQATQNVQESTESLASEQQGGEENAIPRTDEIEDANTFKIATDDNQASQEHAAQLIPNTASSEAEERVLKTSSSHSSDHHHHKTSKNEKEKSAKHHSHHHSLSHCTQYEVTPHLHRACQIFLTSELLYWKTKEDGWDYTFIGYKFFSEPSILYGKMRNVSANFRLGYRNGIKLGIGDSRWDINLVWTTYHNNATRKAYVKGSQNEAATLLLAQSDVPLGQLGARAQWSINFNAIDLEFGYNLGWKSRFAIRPFAGVKLAKIRQKMNALYFQVQDLFPAPVNVLAQNHYTSHNYGLRFGVNSQYNAGCGFKLFLNASAAALWSKFTLLHQGLPPGFPPSSVFHNHYSRINTELELMAGVGWQTFIKDKEYYLDFRLAWEEQMWFSQNQIMRLVEARGQVQTHKYDLTFSGPTFSATFGF